MKCDLCSSPATVFLTQLFNGEIKKTKYCQSCADNQGVTDPTGFALAEMFGKPSDDTDDETTPDFEEELEADFSTEAVELVSGTPSLDQCPNCGFTLEKLRKVGRLGCSQCYQSFRQDIAPTLRNMHGASNHKGKVPSLLVPARSSKQEIEEMESQLTAAIEMENFEEAARLRDELRTLKAEQ